MGDGGGGLALANELKQDHGKRIFLDMKLFDIGATVESAVRGLARGHMGALRFWLLATMVLGGWFLWGTWVEWRGLIWDRGLTLRTNLFGTTFYSLVGFHAFHVTVGLLALLAFWVLALLGRLKSSRDTIRFELVSWYWHFVDVVWIFVFTTVYIVGMRA